MHAALSFPTLIYMFYMIWTSPRLHPRVWFYACRLLTLSLALACRVLGGEDVLSPFFAADILCTCAYLLAYELALDWWLAALVPRTPPHISC